jgi:hypothetical protein
MSGLIERLNKRIVWWESSNRNNRLYDVSDCDLDQELADALEARDKTIAELVEALQSAKELADVMEGLCSGRSDDEWVWAAQDKINAALSQAQSKDKAE